MNWNQSNKNEFDDVLSLYDTADAESSAGAIPPGKYRARLVDGHLDRARTGTACFCIKWKLVDGEFTGRCLVSRHWLTPKAVSWTKKVLAPLGIGGEHMRGACPLPGVMVELKVVHHVGETEDVYQEIKRIRKIDDGTSENGAHAANGSGAATQGNEANTVHSAGETLSGVDEGAVPSGDDSFLDSEFVDFGGKE